MQSKDRFKAIVQYNGNVTHQFPAMVQILCRFDVSNFPYDTQKCKLKFGSWVHSGKEIDLINATNDGLANMRMEEENSDKVEWDVTDVSTLQASIKYPCCKDKYSLVTVHIKLKRRSGFYTINIIYPCVLLTVLAAFMFILPVESGEKVSVGITVLLTLSVYQLLVSDLLPRNNVNPLIG